MSFVEGTPSMAFCYGGPADRYRRALGFCVSDKLPGDPSALHALSRRRGSMIMKVVGLIPFLLLTDVFRTEDVLVLRQWIIPYFPIAL